MLTRGIYSFFLILLFPLICKAETWVITFSDLQSCPPCITQHRMVNSPEMQAHIKGLGYGQQFVDVKTTAQSVLNQWSVNSWPTTFLIKDKKIVKKKIGMMTQPEYLEFLK